jgi:seryl-tRNA synthetase
MFAFTTPDQSERIFNEMLASAEEVLQGLGLHYRLMLLVTGDMSLRRQKRSISVWLPGQNRLLRSLLRSNCTDYQARRSMIRYRKKRINLNLCTRSTVLVLQLHD